MSTDPRPVCVVTGTGGYVGGAVATHLEQRGFRVHRLSRASGYSLAERTPVLPDGDLDVLVHCAYDFSVTLWADISRVNVEGSLRLCEAANRRGVKRIVFISSLAAYDGCASLYGRGKRLVEQAVLGGGGDAIRPGTIFGPEPRGLMGSLTAQVMTRTWVPVVRHAQTLRLVHEEDLGALVTALATGVLSPSPRPWLAAGPRSWNLEQLVKEMARRAGRRITTVPVPWQIVWSGLKALETVGLRPSFRSDSVLSLAHPVPHDQFVNLSVAPLVSPRDF